MSAPTDENPRSSAARFGMSWRAHVRATIALAVPLIGASLGHMAINITDTVMVGWLGATELAAATLGTQASLVVFVFGVGFAQAVMPLVAHAEGRNDVAAVRHSVHMGMWVLALYSAVVMLPLWHLESLLLALGQEPEVAALAGDYMRVAQWGMLPALLAMCLRSHLAVVGKAHVVMWMTFALIVVNAGLNYAFVFGRFGAPALGIVGAAVASLGTKSAGAAWMIWYARRRRELKRYDLFADFLRPEWATFREVLRLGWPIGLTILAEVGMFTATSIFVGWLGTIPLAAHGIAIQLTSIAFMVPVGISNAATVRVGVARGRDDTVALRRAGWTSLGLASGFATLSALIFWLFPEALVSLYLDESNANAAGVLAAAVPLLFVAAAFQIVDGIQAVSAGNLRGLKDTRAPMIIAVVSYWIVGMPAAYGFTFRAGLGAPGVWLGLAAGLTVAAVFLTRRFFVASRQSLGL